jgi:hypothetical protein
MLIVPEKKPRLSFVSTWAGNSAKSCPLKLAVDIGGDHEIVSPISFDPAPDNLEARVGDGRTVEIAAVTVKPPAKGGVAFKVNRVGRIHEGDAHTVHQVIGDDRDQNLAPQAMRLPLRWIAILRDQVTLSLAATSGIHTARDVIKMLLAGADVTMMASALLMHGPAHLEGVLAAVETWMEEREYDSVEQMKGSMSYANVPNPGEFERANYMRALKTFR